jgi:hypothetical protein
LAIVARRRRDRDRLTARVATLVANAQAGAGRIGRCARIAISYHHVMGGGTTKTIQRVELSPHPVALREILATLGEIRDAARRRALEPTTELELRLLPVQKYMEYTDADGVRHGCGMSWGSWELGRVGTAFAEQLAALPSRATVLEGAMHSFMFPPGQCINRILGRDSRGEQYVQVLGSEVLPLLESRYPGHAILAWIRAASAGAHLIVEWHS